MVAISAFRSNQYRWKFINFIKLTYLFIITILALTNFTLSTFHCYKYTKYTSQLNKSANQMLAFSQTLKTR